VKEGRWSNSADSNSLKTHKNRGKTKERGKAQRTGLTGPPAPKCANACELARAIPLLSIAYCAKTETGNRKKQGVFHTVACNLHLKKELWKLKYFTMQKIHFSKNPQKETKILQDVITFITNLKFQHKPKYHLSTILI